MAVVCVPSSARRSHKRRTTTTTTYQGNRDFKHFPEQIAFQDLRANMGAA
jgi:hypothetical protein